MMSKPMWIFLHYIPRYFLYKLQKHTAKGLLDAIRVPHLGNTV